MNPKCRTMNNRMSHREPANRRRSARQRPPQFLSLRSRRLPPAARTRSSRRHIKNSCCEKKSTRDSQKSHKKRLLSTRAAAGEAKALVVRATREPFTRRVLDTGSSATSGIFRGSTCSKANTVMPTSIHFTWPYSLLIALPLELLATISLPQREPLKKRSVILEKLNLSQLLGGRDSRLLTLLLF